MFAGGAQAFDGLVEPGAAARASARRRSRPKARSAKALQRQGEMGAAERQSVERDVENPVVLPRNFNGLAARSRASAARPCESSRSQYSIPLQRVEQGEFRLPFPLPALGVGEQTRGLFPFAGGMERVGMGARDCH